MALPTVTVLNAAIDTIYSVFSNRKTRPGNRYAVGLLQKMRRVLLGAYRGDIDFSVTDLLDDSIEGFVGAAIAADGEDYDIALTDVQDQNLFTLFSLSETVAVDIDDELITDDAETLVIALLSGEIYVGNSNAAVVAGDVFSVAGTGDTSDNKLAAAKGSAPANEDQFLVTSTSSIYWLGNKSTNFADGEVAEAKSSVAAAVGDTFRVQGTADTVANDLEAAKGSAVADNDIFIVTNIGSVASPGSAAVDYLGNAAILAGELRGSSGFGRAPVVGDIFQVGGTGDTTDNALQAAKGSAPADGDVFEVTGVTAGSVAVKYLGAVASISTTDEEIVDFVSLGS